MSGPYVYFIECLPLDAVKIGYTAAHPRARLASLQTGSPSPLRLLTYVEASSEEERRLHRAFHALHIHGEWFRNDGKLGDMIAYLDGDDGLMSSRDTFENALHDVLLTGCWYPHGELSEEAYQATGNASPFADLYLTSFGVRVLG